MLEPRVLRILSTIHLLRFTFGVHVALHVGNVIVLGEIAVFLHVWPLVLRHGRNEVFDDFVRDERVAEVQLGNVWLKHVSS